MSRPTPWRQRGATLVTVMILLLVMTLLGVASVRSTLLQERMSAATYDRNLAFQAAESGLVEGEQLAATRPAAPSSGCASGVCAPPAAGAAPRWSDASFWASGSNTLEAAAALSDAGDVPVAQPRYFLELVADFVPLDPKDCTTGVDLSVNFCEGRERRYRVTSRSQADGRAAVILQSIFSVPINP